METRDREPVDVQTSPPLGPNDIVSARSYQLEALQQAINQNTIVFLETGSGKTLIAILLLRYYAHLFRNPSENIAVFLVPTVVLVTQQADALKMHTNLKVEKYWGEMGVDFWDASIWKEEQEKNEVLVMTPAILLAALRHSFIKLEAIQVLIFDECHNARGKHPYACIMKEFYHHQKDNSIVPRIFGMTASPVKAKGSDSAHNYWKQISELENLMHSKVYTCESESVLANYIPFATTKILSYKQSCVPFKFHTHLEDGLGKVLYKHKSSLLESSYPSSTQESLSRKLSKLSSTFLFCLNELGLWMALEASKALSSSATELFCWAELDSCSETFIRNYILDVHQLLLDYVESGAVSPDMKAYTDAGFITTKVACLVECLLQYRNSRDLRSIIFVERVITAIVLSALLNELLSEGLSWNTEYIAGQQSVLQSQSRNAQNKIVEEFRKGKVNIIVATSILEEGLDVQACNLVVRFDLSATVCSFIQSKGRARMQNSDFLMMVNSEDTKAMSRVRTYITSGEVMRKESLSHANLPCGTVEYNPSDDIFYQVASTGAMVTLSSSVTLVYFYCSRLPSDGYFKSTPKCVLDDASGVCTVWLPNSCPISSVRIEGGGKLAKQLACLEVCKQLHRAGALTDHLVPDIVAEEAHFQELVDEPYDDIHPVLVPHQLVKDEPDETLALYHCYSIKIETDFSYDVPLKAVVFCVKTKLQLDNESMHFNLEDDYGFITVHLEYLEAMSFASDLVLLCRKFQAVVFTALMGQNINEVLELLTRQDTGEASPHLDYLFLPCNGPPHDPWTIDWRSVRSASFSSAGLQHPHACSFVHTADGVLCRCVLDNCLVYTPHNGRVYCINGFLDELNGTSELYLKDGRAISYEEYYKTCYGLKLQHEKEILLRARFMFKIRDCLQMRRQHKQRDSDKRFVELPPELCRVLMSPVSISTFYTYSLLPSIMHRIESLLLSTYLVMVHVDHGLNDFDIPAAKVLEALTTKKCGERFHLESLETLGDSYLKYAVSQQLFRAYQDQHEGLLSVKRERVISNVALCRLGCDRRITGFIRNEPFDPKRWAIPGYSSYHLEEQGIGGKKYYSRGNRFLKQKRVADVVEALIGAFLSCGGELAALLFMDWLGIKVDFTYSPYQRNFAVNAERLVHVNHLESVLNYSFRDKSLLIEALAHGSYMLPDILRCYQRLEFLGDAVLDHLVTVYLYKQYPGISPGLLTELRSASVNNNYYAQSAVKAGLHQHILHASQILHKQIVASVQKIGESASESSFGWEVDFNFPKVLADVVESLAGAIFVDSGYNKEVVFNSIRPLLEPLITPETMKIHPVKELHDICMKHHFKLGKPVAFTEGGVTMMKLDVEANGRVFKYQCNVSGKKIAKSLVSKGILKVLKESIPGLE